MRRGVVWINWVTFFLLLAGAVTGVACAGPMPEVATPSPTSLPTEMPTATPSPSPLPTETPFPAHTPTVNLGKLAYVQGGDIWVKTLPDGESQRLTTDARNSEPRWSPSGEWLAFRKDEQVWLMRTDGSAVWPLNEGTTVNAFAWAPMDDRLAYVAGDDELHVVDADGISSITVVPQTCPERGPGRVGRIAWSPDGRWIAYEWREKPPDKPSTYQGLWRVSADGGQRAELYASGVPEKGAAILAGWSGDGRFLIFWQGELLSASMLADGVPLCALPAEGGTPVRLAEAVLAYSDFVVPEPTRTDRVAVVAGGGRGAWWNKVLQVISASTGEGMPLTSQDLAVSSPVWSPDGQHIAYVVMSDQGDLAGGEPARQGLMERRIWVANTEVAPQPRQLTDNSAYRDERPLWSADGSHILFVRMDEQNQTSLWLIPFEEGAPRLVVGELGPLPGPAPGWFGYYGHVEWDGLYNWYSGE